MTTGFLQSTYVLWEECPELFGPGELNKWSLRGFCPGVTERNRSKDTNKEVKPQSAYFRRTGNLPHRVTMRKRMFSDEVRLPKPKINPKNVMPSGSLVAAHRPHPTTTWKRLFSMFHVPGTYSQRSMRHSVVSRTVSW